MNKEVNKFFNEQYLWEPYYHAAILETDNYLVLGLIYEALAAIEQRLLAPIEINGKEYKALKAARQALQTLKVERFGSSDKTRKHSKQSQRHTGN